MRKLWGLLVGLVMLWLYSGVVAADSMAQINVQASMPAACIIILTNNNQISEIITNSQQEVTPEVYYGNISPAHRTHLTASIYTQYLLLTRRLHHQVGVVYRFSPHSLNQPGNNDLAFKRPAPLSHRLFFLKSMGSLIHA